MSVSDSHDHLYFFNDDVSLKKTRLHALTFSFPLVRQWFTTTTTITSNNNNDKIYE